MEPCIAAEPLNQMVITKVVARCPDIHNQVDGIQIQQCLTSSPGVENVEVDYVAGIVTVTTASQDGGNDVLRVLRDAGFPAESFERSDTGDRPG